MSCFTKPCIEPLVTWERVRETWERESVREKLFLLSPNRATLAVGFGGKNDGKDEDGWAWKKGRKPGRKVRKKHSFDNSESVFLHLNTEGFYLI